MNNQRTYLICVQISLFASTVFFVLYYFSILNLIKQEKPKQYTIIGKSCGMGNMGSSIYISHEGEKHYLNFTKKQCKSISIGQSIELFYNRKYNYFYIPNTLFLYERYIFGCFFCFILTFFPWISYRNKLYHYLDKKRKKP